MTAWVIPTLAIVAITIPLGLLLAQVVRSAMSNVVQYVSLLDGSLERLGRGLQESLAEGRRDQGAAATELRQETRDTLRHQSSLLQEFGSSINQLMTSG